MNDATPPDLQEPDPQEKVALSSLLVALTEDASNFARAEVDYLKAQAGERAHYAVPGLIMFVVGLALATGVLMAIPVGLILLLSPLIGSGLALVAVTLAGLLFAALMFKLGTRRIKAVLKRPEDR